MREDNIKILEQLFFKEDPINQKNYERFFNRSFGLNYEFTKFYLEKERKSHDNCRTLLAKQIEEINDLNSKIGKLEKVLKKNTLKSFIFFRNCSNPGKILNSIWSQEKLTLRKSLVLGLHHIKWNPTRIQRQV